MDLARQKQAGNPEYGFLTGGDGAAFFTWRLFAAVNHLPADQPLAAGQHAAPAAPAAPQPGAVGAVSSSASPALPPEVASGWTQVLAALSGSHTSIRASQEWFMACRQHAQGMAEMMLQVGYGGVGGLMILETPTGSRRAKGMSADARAAAGMLGCTK